MATDDNSGPGDSSRHISADRSYYVPMRDGVRLALSLFFPGGEEPTGNATTILIMTRYGREWVFNMGSERGGGYESFRRAGYVVAVLDDRGSTASFGTRMLELGPELDADMDEVIDHIVAQPWSNGNVLTTGVSYMADTADLSTGSSRPGLTGAIVREADFDTFRHVLFPGGVANDLFLHAWGAWTTAIDTGRMEVDGRLLNCVTEVEDCESFRPHIVAVDDDEELSLLRDALAGRVRWSADAYDHVEFFDDVGTNGHTIFESCPAARLERIRACAKPVQYWGSWMDAGTAASAIDRYRSLPTVPMEVWITPNDHHNEQNADPFAMDRTAPFPEIDAQHEIMRSFIDRVESGSPIERSINYFVLGSGEYRKASTWPPGGAEETVSFFDVANRLSVDPAVASGADHYRVDYSATTGATTRWSTQFGEPPAYGDRRAADQKLLVYTGDPVPEDMELAGTPVVGLHMTSRSSDPVVFVYLEDVSPDGYVTYLTEGVFRAVNRQVADPSSAPYDQGPVTHSYLRADALPISGEDPVEVRFSLFPVAALIKQGHRLRVAIAGADGEQFRRYSEGMDEEIRVFRGPNAPSGLQVHLKPWRQQR